MNQADGATGHRRRPLGLRLILLYKFAKAPLMLAVATWLTLQPAGAYQFALHVAEELSAEGSTLARLGAWIAAHVSPRTVSGGAVLAWLDGATTGIEGILLWFDKPWGEWLVVAGVGVLLPLELETLLRHPSAGKLVVLAVNAAIVVYLARRRLWAARVERDEHVGAAARCSSETLRH